MDMDKNKVNGNGMVRLSESDMIYFLEEMMADDESDESQEMIYEFYCKYGYIKNGHRKYLYYVINEYLRKFNS